MKKLTFISAIAALAFMGSASANARGAKTTDSKATTEVTATPSETKSGAGVNYYWFDVSSDGTTLSDPLNGIPAAQSATASGDCEGNQIDYCQRGFTAAQTTVSGSKRTVNLSVIAIEDSPGVDHKQ